MTSSMPTRAAARARLGALGRDLRRVGATRGRAVRRAHRAPVRRRVDVPSRHRRVEGRARLSSSTGSATSAPSCSTCSGPRPTSNPWGRSTSRATSTSGASRPQSRSRRADTGPAQSTSVRVRRCTRCRWAATHRHRDRADRLSQVPAEVPTTEITMCRRRWSDTCSSAGGRQKLERVVGTSGEVGGDDCRGPRHVTRRG